MDYSSINAVVHYSFDWAQNLQTPHFSQQPSQMYFLSPRKVHLFGFHNEAIGEQTNYLIDENQLLNKGVNGTLSLIFDGIKRLNKGEKHLKLTCDNCAGQNKNNFSLWFYSYLVIAGYYKSIEQNFMIAGHTKFKPDGKFGMIKRKYRKSTTNYLNDLAELVEQSSPAGLNKAQLYEDEKGFEYLEIRGRLETYFRKLPNIGKYHHFLFESSNLGKVKVQEFANGDFVEFDLLKTDDREIAEIIKEIRALEFTVLKPAPLSYQRQEYLYENIRNLVPKKLWDNVCPMPRQIIDNLANNF